MKLKRITINLFFGRITVSRASSLIGYLFGMFLRFLCGSLRFPRDTVGRSSSERERGTAGLITPDALHRSVRLAIPPTGKSASAPCQFITLLLIASVLAGCSSSGRRAPVVERSEGAKKRVVLPKKNLHEKDWRPQVHVVQRGETLYSIAFNYGLDYHELAELNGIQNPSVISVGQEIRLFPGNTSSIARQNTTEGPLRSNGVSAGVHPAASAENKPVESLLKEQPRLVKYPYSEAAVAQIDKVPVPTQPVVSAAVDKVESKPDIKTDSKPDIATDDGEEASLEWSMPTKGRVISEFSESANRKGIDIAGKLGQPIVASAPGKVVYSGSGLRGYGKLVIIKHGNNYLSAYAHNDQVLVKEGQSVARGQKIAEMGNTDADQVKLHFEVRHLGKPVDPAKYLPLGKS